MSGSGIVGAMKVWLRFVEFENSTYRSVKSWQLDGCEESGKITTC